MEDYRKTADRHQAASVATGYGVFFIDEKTAEVFQQRYGGHVEKTDGGWFVRKEIKDTSPDDPIIRAINEAIDKAGLRAK